MFGIRFFRRLSSLGTVLLAGYIFWLGWANLGPRKPEIGIVRQKLADKAIAEVVEDIRQNRGDVEDVVLIHFANDPTSYFTDKFRSVIEQHGVLHLRDSSLVEKFRNKFNLRHPPCRTIEQAVGIGKSRMASAVLFGRLLAFESFPSGAQIEVEYTLADCKSGAVIYSGEYTVDTSKSSVAGITSAMIDEKVRGIPWFKRILGWLIVVLMLPVFTIVFIRTMVSKRSNRTNAFILGIYTLADAIIALLLIGMTFSDAKSVVIFTAAVAAAFFYNMKIMSFALALEE